MNNNLNLNNIIDGGIKSDRDDLFGLANKSQYSEKTGDSISQYSEKTGDSISQYSAESKQFENAFAEKFSVFEEELGTISTNVEKILETGVKIKRNTWLGFRYVFDVILSFHFVAFVSFTITVYRES